MAHQISTDMPILRLLSPAAITSVKCLVSGFDLIDPIATYQSNRMHSSLPSVPACPTAGISGEASASAIESAALKVIAYFAQPGMPIFKKSPRLLYVS